MSQDTPIEGASAPLCTTASSEKLYGIIYRATHVASGKVYVGQTTGKLYDRRKGHVSDAKTCGTRFGNALKKYGSAAFSWDQIDVAYSREELDAKECHWISHYRSTDRDVGFNIVDGGSKPPLSPESLRKMSETKKRQFQSGECKAPNLGMALSTEQRTLISQTKIAARPPKQPKGICHSPSTVIQKGQRISVATEFPAVKIQCVGTSKVYETISQAAREFGISHTNFSMYFKGQRKSVVGHQWIKL